METVAPAAALALALSIASALGADLPSIKGPPPVYLPPPLWTGFYFGVNAGYTWSVSNSVDVVTAPFYLPFVVPGGGVIESALAATPGATGVFPVKVDGFIGGGQIGYNWQFANAFVAGIEADIQGVAGASGSATGATALLAPVPNSPSLVVSTALSVARRIDYLGTVRGRLGYLVTPTLLAYATGGLAYGEVSSSAAFAQVVTPVAGGCFICAPYFTAGRYSDTRIGWTVGGGGEWLFSPNWSAKVEYLYYNLGDVTYSGGALVNSLTQASAFLGVPAGTPIYGLAPLVRTRFNGHIVRAGVNYHFNLFNASPVLAKY